ncbi:MAG: fructose-6-phosphate aldolase [Bdellovibrionales bacterium]
MKFFIDTADINEIRQANSKGWVDGVTTNPSLVAKSGKSFREVIAEICKEIKGPVSAEVLSTQAEEMFKEGKELAKIANNVVVKIPMTEDGLVAVKKLTAEGIKTNVTLVFNPMQALLVAKAGGTMVSPFIGRLDDIGVDGIAMVEEIVHIYRQYDFATEVLVASVRSPLHIEKAALIGADIVTVPYKVMQQMTHHPLTDKGLQMFMDDWKKSGKV